VLIGAVEGHNIKAKVATEKAYRFKSFDVIKYTPKSHGWELA
jgi:hypothetical protein